MTWYPMAFLPPQFENTTGIPYSGAVMKCYREGTSTPIPMATGSDGLTTASSFALNAAGYPVSGGAVIIPHIQENYKVALYPNQAAADANSGAVWSYDEVKIAGTTNSPFFQSFSGDGITTAFILSQSMGTDERALMVFADKPFFNHVTNGDFATDTNWTKGTGWAIGSGVATATTSNASLSQTSASHFENGEAHNVTYTITRTAGTVTPKLGGTSGTARTASGTYTETIIAGVTQLIEFVGSGGFSGTVDDVVVQSLENQKLSIIPPTDYTVSGVNLTMGFKVPVGSANILVYSPSYLFGALGDLVNDAATSEANALAYRNEAEGFRNEAEDFKDAAESAALSLIGSSTTSNTIAEASKSFTTQADKQFNVGNFVLIVSASNPDNYMHGQVTAYSGTGLTVDVTNIGGSGTLNDWVIMVSGTQGPTGPTGPGGIASSISYVNTGNAIITEDELQGAMDQVEVQLNTSNGNNQLCRLGPDGLVPEDNLPAGGGGVVITRQVFTSSGTWTKPANLLYAEVELTAGGGGGVNGSGSTYGSGGGGGGASTKIIAGASLGATETITVGASGAAGNAGGTSSFGSHCSATGGSAGVASTSLNSAKGIGGVGSGGNVNTKGGGGFTASTSGGGGGGDGAGRFGGGTSGIAETGSNYGGGGGGAYGGTAQAGAAGIVVVTEYKSE